MMTIRDPINHILALAETIGPRGSCREGEQKAARYVASVFEEIGLDQVHVQEFLGSPSSYARYALAAALTMVCQLLVVFNPSNLTFTFSAIAYLLATLAVFAESDFQRNWTHWIVRSRASQNVIGRCVPEQRSERQVIITAHIDSHRTPFFNSTPIWQRMFQIGFRVLFISFCLNLTLAIFLISNSPSWLIIPFYLLGLPGLLTIIAFLQADQTPFSPGAYDNASGVACMLSIAEELRKAPLKRTSVWFVATGCEETGAGGMQALVGEKGDAWADALWINLDQTGIGGLYLRLTEGMLRRYGVKEDALALARQASFGSDIPVRERESQAFSDAIIAHKHDLLALSYGASPSDAGISTPRHQMDDTPDKIEPETIAMTVAYISCLLAIWDQEDAR